MEHRRVWGYICEATAGALFEIRLYECHSVTDALRTMREWALPLQPAERYFLVAELEGVQFMEDEDPKFFFVHISCPETTMSAIGIEKSKSEIVQIILRQLPERYDVVKTMTLVDLQLTHPRLENTHPFRLLPTQGPRNCETRAGGGCAGGTPELTCSCRRPWFWGRGGRGRRKPTKERRYGTSRRWHAAAAAATAAMVSRWWYSSSAST